MDLSTSITVIAFEIKHTCQWPSPPFCGFKYRSTTTKHTLTFSFIFLMWDLKEVFVTEQQAPHRKNKMILKMTLLINQSLFLLLYIYELSASEVSVTMFSCFVMTAQVFELLWASSFFTFSKFFISRSILSMILSCLDLRLNPFLTFGCWIKGFLSFGFGVLYQIFLQLYIYIYIYGITFLSLIILKKNNNTQMYWD